MKLFIYKGFHTHLIFGHQINKTHLIPLFGTVRQHNHYQLRELKHKPTEIEKCEVINLKDSILWNNIYNNVKKLTEYEKKFINLLHETEKLKSEEFKFTKHLARTYSSFISKQYLGDLGGQVVKWQFNDYYSDINTTALTCTHQNNGTTYYIKKGSEILENTYIIDLTYSSLRNELNSVSLDLNTIHKGVIENIVYNTASFVLGDPSIQRFKY